MTTAIAPLSGQAGGGQPLKITTTSIGAAQTLHTIPAGETHRITVKGRNVDTANGGNVYINVNGATDSDAFYFDASSATVFNPYKHILIDKLIKNATGGSIVVKAYVDSALNGDMFLDGEAITQ